MALLQEDFLSVFEKGQEGQSAYSIPYEDFCFEGEMPQKDLLRKSCIDLPALSELDLTRHFSQLARRNVGIDTTFIPLGSCTMKLNPRINELCAAMPAFQRAHPLAPDASVQGNLQVMYELIEELCAICGMDGGTLLPNAGAQGEYLGVRLINAYHQSRGDANRVEMLIPDNAHGTNPATAKMAGLATVPIRTDAQGDMDLNDLRAAVSDRTAGLMLTNPNTLGLFSSKILEIAKIVHEAGGLLYYDGANLNPLLAVCRPGDMGFDAMHLNLHKTFSTPHGGGGPGSGPVLCKEHLVPFLPLPQVVKEQTHYALRWDQSSSLGQLASFHGNFSIYLRAYLYMKLHGRFGLRRVAENALLNANYLKQQISRYLCVPFARPCMHEFVVQADQFLDQGVRALDIAKRMLDYGIHAPTIYFPLIVKECMLIEPTETESKATLDRFIAIVARIVEEIQTDPEILLKAPLTTPVSRLDEVQAAKHPVLVF